MNKELIELETKLAFQEDLIEQLNDVVTKQQVKVDDLEKKVEFLIKAASNNEDSGIKDASLEEPPPHY